MSRLNYDVVVVGGGVTGCAIARELSRYEVSACLVERAEDVCSGTSKANSAIVHAGYDAVPGSLKAKFNVQGNAMMGGLSEELDFEFQRNGSMVLCLQRKTVRDWMPYMRKVLPTGYRTFGSSVGTRRGPWNRICRIRWLRLCMRHRRDCMSFRLNHCFG